jgi:phosphate transport system permease protein
MEASKPWASGSDADNRSPLEAQGRRLGEKAIQASLAFCGILSVLTTTAIVVSLIGPTLGFFELVNPIDFLFGTDWSPSFEPASFGVLPIVVGTLSVTLWGMLFAIPIGLACAVYLAEYASPRVRKTVKPILEVLAGIPTVAIGFFAVTFILPEIIRPIWPSDFLGGASSPFMALAAGLGIGLMVVPIIASISEDAMSAVPRGLREGAYALGATKAKVATRVVFPAALSGIVASVILAISRAVGETMIVAIAAGQQPRLTLDPRVPVETMTAYVVQVSMGDTPTGTLEYQTIFVVGAVLFLMTFVMNASSHWFKRRFRTEA